MKLGRSEWLNGILEALEGLISLSLGDMEVSVFRLHP